jgi:hypothetical protein
VVKGAEVFGLLSCRFSGSVPALVRGVMVVQPHFAVGLDAKHAFEMQSDSLRPVIRQAKIAQA